MARIKYVINERRLAYEGAVEILESKRRAHVAAKEVIEAAEKVVEGLVKTMKEASEASPAHAKSVRAEDLAAAGLFASSKVSQSTKQS